MSLAEKISQIIRTHTDLINLEADALAHLILTALDQSYHDEWIAFLASLEKSNVANP